MKSNYVLLSVFAALLCCNTMFAQQWAAVGGVAFSPTQAGLTSMALGKNDTPYIAYLDYGNNDAVSVMKFNGTSWVYVGSPGFSHTVVPGGNETALVLKMDTTGKPWVFFEDSVTPPFSVMTWNGTNWVYIDSAGIAVTQSQPYILSMDIAPDGTPYIAFVDYNHSYAASVMKHTATGWLYVGPQNFTPGGADQLDLEIDHAGNPWLAFVDGNAHGLLSVQKFNGNNWILQGSEGFAYPESGGNAVSMAFDNNNNPYVAYADYNQSNNASVKMLSGGSWVAVGDTDFSTAGAYYLNLKITSGGVPVVAYNDVNNNNHATAEYFNGASWNSLGTPDFSSGEADWVTMAITRAGVPFVGFVDAANGHTASVYSFGVPAGIQNISNLSDLSVYPNPNNGRFQVRMHTHVSEDVQLGLYNMMGQMVWQDNPANVNGAYTTTIDVTGLPLGVYALQVKTQGGVESRMVEVK